MPNLWLKRLLFFTKSWLVITTNTKIIEKGEDHSPGKSNGVFNCIKDRRCKKQRRFSYCLKNEHYRELVIKNRHQETQGLKRKPCWETHPTLYAKSHPFLLARGNGFLRKAALHLRLITGVNTPVNRQWGAYVKTTPMATRTSEICLFNDTKKHQFLRVLHASQERFLNLTYLFDVP